MATTTAQEGRPRTPEDPEKADYAHDEQLKTDGVLENEEVVPRGRRKKTDPVEISLVRKLDWIMMPTLWIMRVSQSHVPKTTH
jgi:hypothetical protein